MVGRADALADFDHLARVLAHNRDRSPADMEEDLRRVAVGTSRRKKENEGAPFVKALAREVPGVAGKSKRDGLAHIARRHVTLVGARARDATRDERTAAALLQNPAFARSETTVWMTRWVLPCPPVRATTWRQLNDHPRLRWTHLDPPRPIPLGEPERRCARMRGGASLSSGLTTL